MSALIERVRKLKGEKFQDTTIPKKKRSPWDAPQTGAERIPTYAGMFYLVDVENPPSVAEIEAAKAQYEAERLERIEQMKHKLKVGVETIKHTARRFIQIFRQREGVNRI